MLTLALHSRLPLVWVTSTDPLNDTEVIRYLAETEGLNEIGISIPTDKDPKNSLLTDILDYDVMIHLGSIENYSLRDLYDAADSHQVTLVVVNRGDAICPAGFFDAGHLKAPSAMMREFLQSLVPDSYLSEVTDALKGLDMKDVQQVTQLTSARDGSLTARGIMSTRKIFINSIQGLSLESTNIPFYNPHEKLEKWIALNKKPFLYSQIPSLVPKGILMNGDAGTGKSLGAKHIADSLGVSLLRLDLGALMSKWLGEAESNMTRALAMVEECSPCVLLLDEVEKVFSSSEDSGSTTRMMGQLLWWLQEKPSRVLVVMTTNDQDKIPPELYRKGRIDTTMTIEGLTKKEATDFFSSLLGWYKDQGLKVPTVGRMLTLATTYNNVKTVSPADLTQLVEDELKTLNF
ncbi:MAG: AAA family ATPase [Gammaproteobacteria bacterium]|nr:AAA family ATPase [Gammaproteobacteria bacterium]